MADRRKSDQRRPSIPVAYVGGPYRAATIHGVAANIRAAEAVAVELWRYGWAVICPHLNSAFLDGAVPDEAFLTGDLEILSRCDALVLTDGWGDSSGAVAEHKYASRLGLEIYEWERHSELLRQQAHQRAHTTFEQRSP